jgi:catechol 2,3-dioxygenase-like lactoylglutathione lyase family enzyme
MRIDHIIIGTDNIISSINFYTNLLSFRECENFIDSRSGNEGKILTHNDQTVDLKILLVPFEKYRLPNPQHIAFIVEKKQFDSIYNKALFLNIKLRAEPNLHSNKDGFGMIVDNNKRYKNFYVSDPSGVNIEILRKIE